MDSTLQRLRAVYAATARLLFLKALNFRVCLLLSLSVSLTIIVVALYYFKNY